MTGHSVAAWTIAHAIRWVKLTFIPRSLSTALIALRFGVERVDRQGAERGRGRHRPALVHRLGEHRRRSAQRLGLPGRCGRPAWPSSRRRRSRPRARPPWSPCRPGPIPAPSRCRRPSPPRSAARPERRGRCRRRRARLGAVRRPAIRLPRRRSPRERPRRAGGHLGQRLADLNGVVGGDEKLGDRARGRGRHLGVDLVGRDLDHRVALVDLVALGDVPLEHRALGHRLAHLRHRNNNGSPPRGRPGVPGAAELASPGRSAPWARRSVIVAGLGGLGRALVLAEVERRPRRRP